MEEIGRKLICSDLPVWIEYEGCEYMCIMSSELGQYRSFYLTIDKLEPAKILWLIPYNKTVWSHTYHVGFSSGEFENLNVANIFEWIGDELWFHPEEVKKLIPLAIENYHDKVKLEYENRQRAQNTRHQYRL